MLFPTALVGSYPQPEWLIDRQRLAGRFPPRVRARELAACACRQVSVETAQSNLDCAVLAKLEGKVVMVGCVDLSSPEVETPEVIRARVRRALAYLEPENVILAPDCGMKYLPRAAAFGKLQAMVAAARMLRAEFAR